MISEENLIQLSSVRDRWITEIRSANITTDANPGTTIPQPPDCCRSRSQSCTALEARLSSGLIKADGDNKMQTIKWSHTDFVNISQPTAWMARTSYTEGYRSRAGGQGLSKVGWCGVRR